MHSERVRTYAPIACGLGCMISSLIPGIVLLILHHTDDIQMNTIGYINPSPDCTVQCEGPFMQCTTKGLLNVSFYPPLQVNTELIFGTASVPTVCVPQAGNTSCCPNLIYSHTPVWMYVKLEDQTYEVKYIDSTPISNTGIYWTLGYVLLITSIMSCCGTLLCANNTPLYNNIYTCIL